MSTIANDLNLYRTPVPIGKELRPFEDIYPEEYWINLSTNSAGLGSYGTLSPTRTLHPMTSIIGITYFSLATVVMSANLSDRDDKIAIISSDVKMSAYGKPQLPYNLRKPVAPLIHMLMFERYVRDTSYRRAIKKAVAEDVYFDIYKPGSYTEPPTSTYFSSWYPELINSIVLMDKTGEVPDLLEEHKSNKWYKGILYCSEQEFLDGFDTLVDEFRRVSNLHIMGKYWTSPM